MKRSEAAKYARWSAAAALVLASLTAGVYVQRKWTAHREKENAPPPAPKEVTRLSSGLTFSKVEGNRKIFTVEAKKATDYKDRAASLMEDVTITIFGNTGERHDTIQTKSCQYEKDGASVVCSGEVQIELESAAEVERAERSGGSTTQKVQVQTRGVTFNRSDGIAHSDQHVSFEFPNGKGEATGVEYRSAAGAIRLEKDVSFFLTPSAGSKTKPGPQTHPSEPVHVTGRSADFARDSGVLHLHGPVEAHTETAQLLAGELTLTLDKEFRAEKLVGTSGSTGKNPSLQSNGDSENSWVSGETLTAYFAPQGWLTKIEGAGTVQGSNKGEKDTAEFTADDAVMMLRPKTNQPSDLKLTGNVFLKTTAEAAAESRTLKTDALLVEFAENEKQGSKPKRAETLAKGTLEWTDTVAQNSTPPASGAASKAHTELTGDKLELEFDEQGRAKQLMATGNVQTERTLPDKPVQIATAQSGIAQLLENGGWSQIELHGNVKLKEGDRSGQADQAVFVRSAQTATLTGKAMVRDATTETHAPRITFVQSSGDIHAEGGVRSTDFSAKGSGIQLAPAPANISAATLEANSKSGRALYRGHARLWQGDSVMEADSIELLRDSKILNATGNVRAVFPQAASQSSTPALGAQQPLQRKPQLWHVSAETLNYFDTENRAHLEKNVVAKSADQTMRAPTVELYFVRGQKGNAGTASAPANTSTGPQQISRAVGTGGVTVDQGTRKAVAERGEYSAVDGKFVMSGGTPTIFDATEGTTTGRQLTFFLADDTIIVDSENGSRTLTKHRVEK
jgi:LPS export ABC transporter protein LptC